MRRVVVGVGLLWMVASSAGAEVIRPDLRCGPPIPREQVKVLDVSGLPADRAAAFIHEQVGEVEVVKEEVVQARSAFGKAMKKAEKRAAEMGCAVVIVFTSGKAVVGSAAVVNPGSPLIVAGPIRRDQSSVAYARPIRSVSGSS